MTGQKKYHFFWTRRADGKCDFTACDMSGNEYMATGHVLDGRVHTVEGDALNQANVKEAGDERTVAEVMECEQILLRVRAPR